MLSISESGIKFQIDNLKIKVINVNYGVFYKPFPKHRHGKNFYEAHLVRSGSGKLIADGKEYDVKGGILYMTGPLVEHEQITNNEDPMDEYCIQFEINESKNGKSGKTATFLKETIFWIGDDTQSMLRLFEMLTDECENKKIGYIQSVINLTNQIMVCLARNYAGSDQAGDYAPITPDDKRMIIADECFMYSYKSITLDILSNRLNLSKRQTQRFLKKAYGKSFIELRTEKRRIKAKELISQGKSAAEAAVAVGYENEKSLKLDDKV